MDETRKIAEQLWTSPRSQYGTEVFRVILYGSYARDTATPASNVDILVVVEDGLDPWQVRRSLDDLLLDLLLLEEGWLVSVLVVPKSYYEGYNSPFMTQVRREGIPPRLHHQSRAFFEERRAPSGTWGL